MFVHVACMHAFSSCSGQSCVLEANQQKQSELHSIKRRTELRSREWMVYRCITSSRSWLTSSGAAGSDWSSVGTEIVAHRTVFRTFGWNLSSAICWGPSFRASFKLLPLNLVVAVGDMKPLCLDTFLEANIRTEGGDCPPANTPQHVWGWRTTCCMSAALQMSTISVAKSSDFTLKVTFLPGQLTVASEDDQMRHTDDLPVCQLLWNKDVAPMSFLGSFALAPIYLHDTRLVSDTFRTWRGASAISARCRGFRYGMSPTRETRVLPN